MNDELPEGSPPMRDFQHYIPGESLPNHSHYQINPKESEVLKENVQLKLEKINAKYKAATDKKRQEKHFEERDTAMSKTFNVVDLFEYHPTKQLTQIKTRGRVLLKRDRLM